MPARSVCAVRIHAFRFARADCAIEFSETRSLVPR
jgi:hypothetical protein